MTTLAITPQQARTLATHAPKGTASVTTLGLPDRTSVLVVHYTGESLVIDVDGRVTSRGQEAVA